VFIADWVAVYGASAPEEQLNELAEVFRYRLAAYTLPMATAMIATARIILNSGFTILRGDEGAY
jgi:hypothetical protein